MSDNGKTTELETPEEIAAARAEIGAEVFQDADHHESAEDATPPVDDDAVSETDSEDDKGLKAKDAEKAEETEDLYAGLNPALRAHLEAQDEVLKETRERLKQSESRVGSLQNTLQNQKAAAEKAEADAKKAEENAPSKEEIAAAAESDEAWAEMVAEYPEWTGAISGKLSPLEKRLEALETNLAESNGDAGNAVIEELRAEIKQIKGISKLSSAHPDWEDTVASDDFKAWIAIQAPEVHEQYASYEAEDAIAVLDFFESREGKPAATQKTAAQIAQEKKDRLKAGRTPAGSGKRIITAKTDDELSEAELRDKIAAEVFAED